MNRTDQSILITGGSGSFGHAFTEYLLSNTTTKRIVIYSRDEYKQFLMRQKFAAFDHRLRFFIGDVRDESRLEKALYGVDCVVHAAAMKQVPACEYNPIEAVRTNIHGAENIINATLDTDSVKQVIALSTDKAVNPINLYGGTKLVSDKIFTAANSYAGGRKTSYSLVRYGNVAGSRGSVIPFFRDKLEQGIDTLPLTDERMTRFWMTLDGAVKLVVKAMQLSKGGETFVYKNPSFYVTDLIEAMNPGGGYTVTGIREGEKLHECMITTADSRRTFEYEDHYVVYPNYDWCANLEDIVIPGGTPVKPDWEYSSESNPQWLGVQDLRQMLPLVN